MNVSDLARKDYAKDVAIVGTESCNKSEKLVVRMWTELDKVWLHKSFSDDSDELLHLTATENFLNSRTAITRSVKIL
jgi:hypothetical protein